MLPKIRRPLRSDECGILLQSAGSASPLLMHHAVAAWKTVGHHKCKGSANALTSCLEHDGPLAQMVEHLLCKQDVVGSIPTGSTKQFLNSAEVGK